MPHLFFFLIALNHLVFTYVWDYEGLVKWDGARAIPRLGSALDTQAETMKWAILSIYNLEYLKVIFESDSKTYLQD